MHILVGPFLVSLSLNVQEKHLYLTPQANFERESPIDTHSALAQTIVLCAHQLRRRQHQHRQTSIVFNQFIDIETAWVIGGHSLHSRQRNQNKQTLLRKNSVVIGT